MDSRPHFELIVALAVGGCLALAIQPDFSASYYHRPRAVLKPHCSRDGSIMLMKVWERTVAKLVADTDSPDWSHSASRRNGLEHGKRGNQFRGAGKTPSVADGLQNRCVLLSQEAVQVVIGID